MSILLPLLLPLSFVLLTLVIRRRFLADAVRWRLAGLIAAAAWAVWLVTLTEVLSLLRSLDRPSVAVAWGALTVTLLWLYLRGHRQATSPASAIPARPSVRRRRLHAAAGILLVPVGAIVLALLIIALVAAPNTHDALTYHMSRVAHWVQNRGVQHYPTPIARQIFMPPGAEFIILHFQLLNGGGDRFANVVQWAAMLGSVAAVSLIARQLGGGPSSEVLAAVFCATIPMGILQGSSTQNDWVEAFWLACFVGLVFQIMRRLPNSHRPKMRRTTPLLVPAAGAAIGMALLTKATAYPLALPFGALLAIAYVLRRRTGAVVPLLGIAALALALSAGHFARNLRSAGFILGPRNANNGTDAYTNQRIDLRTLASNILRNLSIQASLPTGYGLTGLRTVDPWVSRHLKGLRIGEPGRLWEPSIERAVRAAHRWIGADPDDEQTTFGRERYAVQCTFWNLESSAASPLHTLLILLALAALPLLKSWRGKRRTMTYAAALVGSFLLFCLILRWQPVHNRLMLPIVALGSPLVAVVIARSFGSRQSTAKAVVIVIGTGLLLASIPWVVNNRIRPILSAKSIFLVKRDAQYFANYPNRREPFLRCAAAIREGRCRQVGLLLGSDDWEYPLWALSRAAERHVRIEHVQVNNYTAACVEQGDVFEPCLTVKIRGNQVTWDDHQDPTTQTEPGTTSAPRTE
jgi:hypothetical protein